LYRERLGPRGPYFASPVAGDGKVYAASRDGVVVVFAAGDELKILARNDLDELIAATPAPMGGKLYVRTEKHLYAFGE
jgi:outer membrane protein assembly factor BamB